MDVWLVHESLLCNRKYYTVMENICFLLLLRWLISTYLSSGKSSHEFLNVFGRHISFDRSSSAAGGIYNGRESYGWLHFRLHGLLTAWTTHCSHMFKKKRRKLKWIKNKKGNSLWKNFQCIRIILHRYMLVYFAYTSNMYVIHKESIMSSS